MGDDRASEECVPMACSLGAGELGDRIVEWQVFYERSVTSMVTTPTSARLQLDPSDETLVAAASLGQREKECCPFFNFAIEIQADQRWLAVQVPEGAEATLVSLTEMLARHGTATRSQAK